MKFWLLIFFLTPEGEFVDKREVSYENAAKCYEALADVRKPKDVKAQWNVTVRAICVSDDHYTGVKQDPGVDYDL